MKSDKDNIHPEDMRNMFLFFIAAMAIYFMYNQFIAKPQQEAAMKAQKVYLQEKAKEPEAPTKMLTRDQSLAESPRIKIENGALYGSISLKGARIDDISFKDYYTELDKKQHVDLLSPKNGEFPRYVEYGWVADDEKIKLPNSDSVWSASDNGALTPEHPVHLSWDNGQGLHFERTISLDDNFMISVDQNVTNNTARKITLYPYGLVTQTGFPPFYQGVWISHEGPIGYIGKNLMEVKYQALWKEPTMEFTGAQGWAGITDKYWLTALLPPQGQDVKYHVGRTGPLPEKKKAGGPLPKDWGKYQVDYTGSAIDIEPGKTGESLGHVFAGAKKVIQLQDYGKQYNVPNFDLAVDFGWYWFITKPFFYLLHFINSYVGNMGVAIILLTVLIRGAAFPLTNISYRSFAKMKKVSPQVVELRKTYGEDKKRLQEELVKVYEREGVNPLAGCFPMLIQIPIFFSLYKVLFVTIEMRHAPFAGWIHDLSAKDPTNIFNLFGLIHWTPPEFLHVGALPLMMMSTMYMQQRLNPPPQDPLQKDMAIYMPITMTYIMSKFAAGLVVYWVCSAVIGLIQQIVIMKSLGVPVHLLGETKKEKKMEEELAKGPIIHPLVEMAEKEAGEKIFGNEEGEVVGGAPTTTVSPPKGRRKKKK